MSLKVAKTQSSRLLACSPRNDENIKTENIVDLALLSRRSLPMATSSAVETTQQRQLLSDRQAPFAHLTPRNLALNTFRVVARTSSAIFVEFMTDKLEVETKHEELVTRGDLTPTQADDFTDDWEYKEWGKRWKTFPKKAVQAYLRYHAVTLLTRWYEFVASRLTNNDNVLLDRLTQDTFKTSKRTAEMHRNDNNNNDATVAVAKEMFSSCLWANLLCYLADYTVQQGIITYGYYVYHRNRREVKRCSISNTTLGKIKKKHEHEDEDCDEGAAVIFSLSLSSSKLISSRCIGLLTASIGGAIGSVLRPGWGTLIGFNMGDGMSASILDPKT